MIILMNYIDGTEIQTNGKSFINSDERRDVAKWEGAIKQLVLNDLIVERGAKGELFEVTDYGYRISDMISL